MTYKKEDKGARASERNEESVEKMHRRFFYITDVVTAREHRRKRVAATLMKVLEERALQVWERLSTNKDRHKQESSSLFPSTTLLLHVEHDNDDALRFYKALGYSVMDDSSIELFQGLDTDRLAENAQVRDQLLLFKNLSSTTNATNKSKPRQLKKKGTMGGSKGRGFGR